MEIPNKIWAVRDGRFIDYSLTVDDEAYINVNYLRNLLSARIKETEEELKTVNTSTMSGGQKANRLRSIKKELKYIITQL